MVAHDLEQRSIIGRIGNATRLANTTDRAALTAEARRAFLDTFERQVDPDGTLDPAERAFRAEQARKAHFLRLALKSAQARKARKYAEQLEAEVQQGLDAAAGQQVA